MCHRDIKLDNILIGNDGGLKLMDFGCSAPLYGFPRKGYLDSVKGTEFFMPPEVTRNSFETFNKKAYDGIKSDIFSLGVTLFCLLFN